MTYAEGQGLLREYVQHTFERFFQRDLELGEPEAIKGALAEVGVDIAGFDDWFAGEGMERHERERQMCIEMGVFGVPTFSVDGELFWGGDRLWMVEEKLAQITGKVSGGA